MSPFDINSVVFHIDDFNYGRRSQPYFYYSFIPMSGCVGMSPRALLFLDARDAVKTALLLLLLSKKQ
jgi:hypothetical protein